MNPENHGRLHARLDTPIRQPDRPAFPESGTCPGCGGRLCAHCARVFKLTRQHLKPDGTCPYGHRDKVKGDDGE